jgi:4-amino-4-deoxy-L-arabinose transferase-like glycosyltransferase
VPPDTAFQGDQELRLLNGVLSKYGIGLITSVSGIAENELNTRWIWGEDWYVNQYYGHIPVNPLLFIARMSSALMTLLSVALVFRIVRMLGNLNTAALITFIYATMPAVLLNGRRAMFEGAFLLATALLVFAAINLARYLLSSPRLQNDWRRWVFFAITLGLAPAAKHTAILPAIPILMVLVWLGRKQFIKTAKWILVSFAIAGAVFLSLNPAWWSQPLEVPKAVLKFRQELLNQQLGFFNIYTNPADRVSALVGYTFGGPQYFEEHFNGPQGWQDWLKDQIAAYQVSGLTGVQWSQLGIAAWAFIVIGIAGMFSKAFARHVEQQNLPQAANLTLVAVTIFSVPAIFVLTPLAWQRYYLPLALPLAAAMGIGIITLINVIPVLITQIRKASPVPQR